ncbi:NUDIX domain-containing protein [Haloprofundus salilacus]|uniref:NUDIX domain-containing protein n=1 Tax=Haloprofundus salilacus TaxID=2876190 RepID=UPI001CCCC4B1|nr:NUDIX hydrolase [Haloprofundus salilacus]
MENTSETTDVGPIADIESLHGRDDVPFHEQTDLVDDETFDVVADLDDMAPIGVTTDDGSILVMRVTDTCRWKIPAPSVAPGEGYAKAAQRWVAEQTGLGVTLDAVEGVWSYTVRLENDDRKATRNFVVFSATPETSSTTPNVEAGDAVDAGWFDALPENAERPPGTDLFFD